MGWQPSGKQPLNNERMSGKQKNPKQVLIDWVENVQTSAERSNSFLNNGCTHSAQQELCNIVGQCTAMMTVLRNSD